MWDFFYYEREFISYLCDFFIVKSKSPPPQKKKLNFLLPKILIGSTWENYVIKGSEFHFQLIVQP